MAAAWAVLLCTALGACARERFEAAPVAAASRETSQEADSVRDLVVVAATVPGSARGVIEPAPRIDEYATAAPVRVRRFIYRFVVRVPFWLGHGRSDIVPPSGELRVDVGGPRLRAQFVGNGFPVDENSEVRMRSDVPGTYVFDARGGRYMGTGQLASWFQSGVGARTLEFGVRVSAPDDPVVVDMVCRLFGEWAGTSIAAVRRACSADGMPIRMTFGPYLVDRTAEATIEVPARTLRADHLDPPVGLTHTANHLFHSAEMLGRLEGHIDNVTLPRLPPGETRIEVSDGLLVENRTGARVLLVVDGIGLGWLDSGTEPVPVHGIPGGGYLVGAMLPLGGTAARARGTMIPAHMVFGRAPADSPLRRRRRLTH